MHNLSHRTNVMYFSLKNCVPLFMNDFCLIRAYFNPHASTREQQQKKIIISFWYFLVYFAMNFRLYHIFRWIYKICSFSSALFIQWWALIMHTRWLFYNGYIMACLCIIGYIFQKKYVCIFILFIVSPHYRICHTSNWLYCYCACFLIHTQHNVQKIYFYMIYHCSLWWILMPHR